MSTNFTLQFLGDYIRIQHPDDYEITPESQRKLWGELGKACNKYGCWRVLAESQAPPKRIMSHVDAFRSAGQAAKASTKLRVAIVLKRYEPDNTTEFFVNSAYKYGVRIEFFTDPEKAKKWLGLESVLVD